MKAKVALFVLFYFNCALTAEIRLNTYLPYDQKDVDMAAWGENVTMVWNSYMQDGDSGGIFARTLSTSGAVAVDEFQVNREAAGNQAEPAVAVTPTGITLFVWRGPWPGSDEEDIIARIFDAKGLPLTTEFRVNANTEGSQLLPRVAASTDRFVVVWENRSIPDRSKRGVCSRIIDANGTPLSDEMIACDRTYAARFPDVAMNNANEYTVAWMEDRTTDCVRARHFNAQGQAKADSFQVNTLSFKSITSPSVTLNDGVTLVVAWDGDPNRAADDDIHMRLFDGNDLPLAEEILVNPGQSGTQENPDIAVNDHGDIIVTWQSNHPSEGTTIMTRYFDANAMPAGDEFPVHTPDANDREQPCVAMNDQGHFLIAWEEDGSDTSQADVYVVMGIHPVWADFDSNGEVNYRDYDLFMQHWCQGVNNPDYLPDPDPNGLDIFCSEWLLQTVPDSLRYSIHSNL